MFLILIILIFSNGKETGIIKKYFKYDDELKDIKLHPVVKESADLDKGTMIFVGIGSEDATDAKNARGLLNITITAR